MLNDDFIYISSWSARVKTMAIYSAALRRESWLLAMNYLISWLVEAGLRPSWARISSERADSEEMGMLLGGLAR
jgi:hypothetical protein